MKVWVPMTVRMRWGRIWEGGREVRRRLRWRRRLRRRRKRRRFHMSLGSGAIIGGRFYLVVSTDIC